MPNTVCDPNRCLGGEHNETDEDGQTRRVWKKVQRARIKESPDGQSLPNQNTILINIKWYYFKRYEKKYNSINKNQHGLE